MPPYFNIILLQNKSHNSESPKINLLTSQIYAPSTVHMCRHKNQARTKLNMFIAMQYVCINK